MGPASELHEGVLTRRKFVVGGAAAATSMLASGCTAASSKSTPAARAATETAVAVPDEPTAARPEPRVNWREFSALETVLAFRNHGMHAELLRDDITPLGAHYLLIRFDAPRLSANNYSITIGGRVRSPVVMPLAQLTSRPTVTQAVTLECAGTGRSTTRRRAVYVL